MPYKPNERVYRAMAPLQVEDAPDQYRARGYACTFERYFLYEDEDGPVYEQILPTAFAHADMSDVIFQFDHGGRVYARNTNGSLSLSVDDHGLLTEEDLSLTSSARSIWEDIKAKLLTRMSFCFTVKRWHYDASTNTNIIEEIGKVYDVSVVSIPANPGTDIEARCALDGEILGLRAERRKLHRRMLSRIKIDILLGGKTHG